MSVDSPILCHLTNVGFLSVQGPDANQFLQGQLTCDMREINQSKTSLAGHCNPKGRLHGICQVIQLKPEHYCLLMPFVQLSHMQASLKKYAVFSKVKIEIAPWHAIGLLADAKLMENIDPKLIDLEINQQYDLDINADNPNTYIRIPSHESHIYRYIALWYSAEQPEEKIKHYSQKLEQLGFKNTETAVWHKYDILALLPTIYPETTEKCLVHTLNLPKLGAVSFKKGCYTGQEIVARMEYLGNVKKTIACREFQPNSLSGAYPVLGESLPDEDKPDHILLDFVPIENGRYLGLFVTER